MQFSIHVRGIELTEAIKKQTRSQLELALDRLESDIHSIKVYLADTNGPDLGGIDKACRIVVELNNQDTFEVEDCDVRVDLVIERITDRLAVTACQRADVLHKRRSAFSRWRDLDEFTA